MSTSRHWSWIPLVLLAVVAAVFPALLYARPVPSAAVVVTPALARPAHSPADEIPAARPPKPWRHHEDSEIQNLALCTATGFAGGFTLFLCITGWGMFRIAMPRNAALGAFFAATAASLVGFLMGFSGFLQLVTV